MKAPAIILLSIIVIFMSAQTVDARGGGLGAIPRGGAPPAAIPRGGVPPAAIPRGGGVSGWNTVAPIRGPAASVMLRTGRAARSSTSALLDQNGIHRGALTTEGQEGVLRNTSGEIIARLRNSDGRIYFYEPNSAQSYGYTIKGMDGILYHYRLNEYGEFVFDRSESPNLLETSPAPKGPIGYAPSSPKPLEAVVDPVGIPPSGEGLQMQERNRPYSTIINSNASNDKKAIASIYLRRPYEYECDLESVDKQITRFHRFIDELPHSPFVPEALSNIAWLELYTLNCPDISYKAKALRLERAKACYNKISTEHSNVSWGKTAGELYDYLSQYRGRLEEIRDSRITNMQDRLMRQMPLCADSPS